MNAVVAIVDEMDVPPTRCARFEARLEGRDEFPLERLDAFATMRPAQIRAAARNTREVAVRLRVDVRYGIARGLGVGEVLASFDLALFSCDHDWREIFKGLARRPSHEHDELSRIALSAYLRYLDSRQRHLSVLADRVEQAEVGVRQRAW